MYCPNCESEKIDEHEITDDYDRYRYSTFSCEDCDHDWNNKPAPFVYKK